jgi:hypothetical protein
MYAIALLGLGIAASLIGLIVVAFGVPIKEFSLGNTLIIAGTTVFAGGLVLIGLALAVQQLQRIADALAPRSRSARERVASEPAAPRVPLPPRPAGEPRTAAPAVEMPVDLAAERQRPQAPLPRALAEPPMVDDADDATLSPHPPNRPATFEPKLDIPARTNGSDPGEGTAQWPPVSAKEPQVSGGLFDSFWPARQNKASAAQAEPRVESAPAEESRREASVQDAARPELAPAPSPAAAPPPVAAERRPAAILKSGVVDGMAYTLYTDGSIEAELPEGTVRFGSIGELREHLEKHP